MTESFYVYETQVKPIRKLEVAGGGVMKLEKFKFGDIIENGWAGEKAHTESRYSCGTRKAPSK